MCTQCLLVIRTNLVICIFSKDINASIDSFNAFLPYLDTDPRFPTGLFLCVCERNYLKGLLQGKGIIITGEGPIASGDAPCMTPASTSKVRQKNE